MCGIAGILSLTLEEGINSIHCEKLIHRMHRAIYHRGPDDRGVYISQDQQATFAHTRLSILDLSSAGHQPMSISDGRYWITFNGEIYNFQVLRSQLQAEGVTFHSNTDTEVILRLYERYGCDCLTYIRGMFAFAIWDDWEKIAFLARDPLGIKPLYYWQSGSTLVFGSELRAILASGLPSKQLSPSGLYGYLTTGSVPEPHTLIDQVYLLQAGHFLQWQAGETQQHRYWKIDFHPNLISPEDAINLTRSALLDSVKHHLISDVPIGIFLSGGIDSTALVALTRQTQTNPIHTYSIAFEETQWNEGDLARQVAQHFGTEHSEYVMTAAIGRSLLPKFLSTLDQPSIDGFNTFCVSQIAQQQGAKVVLSGLGGDELFGGYKSFQRVPQMVRWGGKLKKISPITESLGMGLEHWTTSPRLKRIGDFLQRPSNSTAAYQSFRGIFTHQEACTLMRHYLPDTPAFPRADTHTNQFPSLEDEVSALELTHYMRNQLLRDSDVMSMAWGLELRVPFVDCQLLETIASIPSSLRLAPGKQLLIQSVPELPPWVLNKPKQGFSFPFQQWLEAEWQEYFPVLDHTPQISRDLWYRRWSLAILQQWWDQISA